MHSSSHDQEPSRRTYVGTYNFSSQQTHSIKVPIVEPLRPTMGTFTTEQGIVDGDVVCDQGDGENVLLLGQILSNQ